jgi:RimJ/RimL family protein N-acetyltransferase
MDVYGRLKYRIGEQQFAVRSVTEQDVTKEYVEALMKQRAYLTNNPESITIDWQKKYVEAIRRSQVDALCGLFRTSQLIATAGVQNIRAGETSTIGIFVLDENARGRGFGKAVLWSTCHLVHEIYHVGGFEAGVKCTNVPSIKSFLSVGFGVKEERSDSYRFRVEIDRLRKPEKIEDVILERVPCEHLRHG